MAYPSPTIFAFRARRPERAGGAPALQSESSTPPTPPDHGAKIPGMNGHRRQAWQMACSVAQTVRLLRWRYVVLAAAFWPPQLWTQHLFLSEGHEHAGDQVCVYQPAERGNVLDNLRTDEVRCFPTETVLALGAGALGYFLKNESEARISAGHGVIAAAEAPGQKLQALRWRTGPAAFLNVSRVLETAPKGAHLSIVIRASAGIAPTVMPIPPGSAVVLIPASIPVVPILMQGATPLWVGKALTLSPNARESLTPPPGTRQDLIASVRVAESGDSSKVPPPEVTLMTASGTRIEPEEPRALTRDTNSDLLIFRNVPPGKASLEVAGPLWSRARQAVTIGANERVTLVHEPLPAIAAGQVTVSWSVPSTVPSQIASCDEAEPQPAAYEVVLLRCAGLEAESNLTSLPLSRCEVERKVPVARTERNGAVAIDGVADGRYLAELRYGGLPPARAVVVARPATYTSGELRAGSTFIHGRLTRNAKPVKATISFFTGVAVSSADTGDYFALVSGDPGRSLIEIKACDGSFSYAHLPVVAPVLNSSYDISVPDNDVTVTVVDRATRAPVPGADLTFGPANAESPGGGVHYLRGSITDAKGQSVLGPFVLPLQFSLCGLAEGYLRRCQDQELRKDHEALTFELTRGESRSGRIDVPGYVFVLWADAAGKVTELVPVNDDGSFRYEAHHEAGESFFLVSNTLALVALRQPQLKPGDPLEIAVPRVPARAFTIRLGDRIAQQNAWIDVSVGDVLIPMEVLNQHQQLRNLRSLILKRAPLSVGAIAQTGPITVLLGPDPETVPHTPGMTLDDLFRRFGANLPRAVVTSNEVVFGP
jgi:hypothetical protein